MQSQKHFSKIKLNEGDYIITPGASINYLLSHEFTKNKSLFDWLQSWYTKKINLASICTGAFVLAQAGLLNNLFCTTHFKLTEQLKKRYPAAKVKENILFVEDNIKWGGERYT